jgi:endonuclease/exonuclease/phosphatase family metal-dependent hydrolase
MCDYIMVSPSIDIVWTETLPDYWNQRQLSDHRAILADLDL